MCSALEPHIKTMDVHVARAECVCLYTCVPFPYRLRILHFHSDTAGEAAQMELTEEGERVGIQLQDYVFGREEKQGRK